MQCWQRGRGAPGSSVTSEPRASEGGCGDAWFESVTLLYVCWAAPTASSHPDLLAHMLCTQALMGDGHLLHELCLGTPLQRAAVLPDSPVWHAGRTAAQAPSCWES